MYYSNPFKELIELNIPAGNNKCQPANDNKILIFLTEALSKIRKSDMEKLVNTLRDTPSPPLFQANILVCPFHLCQQ